MFSFGERGLFTPEQGEGKTVKRGKGSLATFKKERVIKGKVAAEDQRRETKEEREKWKPDRLLCLSCHTLLFWMKGHRIG